MEGGRRKDRFEDEEERSGIIGRMLSIQTRVKDLIVTASRCQGDRLITGAGQGRATEKEKTNRKASVVEDSSLCETVSDSESRSRREVQME
jgi:hypothetical protein